MFEGLQDRLGKVIRDIRGVGTIKEGNITEALTEVKRALLEADVNYRVTQSLIDSVKEQALGQEVLKHVSPSQQFIKILYDEMVRLLGQTPPAFPKPTQGPIKILMVGLQGTGKTTSVAKLGVYLKNELRHPALLVPADTSRPAAREQLKVLGEAQGLKVFDSQVTSALEVCRQAWAEVSGRAVAASYVLFDTAGRLAIDAELMSELQAIKADVKPHLVLYALDATAGQDAVKTAQAFDEALGIDGVVVTKADGDSRGGAILSVRHMLGKPVFFVGTGETAQALEPFYPDRMASRILGMGDIVTLVEKAQKAVDEEQSKKLAAKIRKNDFNIEDFLDQMHQVQKMGSFKDILGLLPGGNKLSELASAGLPEKEMKRVEAIIRSMTPRERRNHQIIDGSRRKRIAAGSGTTVADVNRFLNQFIQARKMMTRLGQIGMKGMQRGRFFG